MIRFFPECTQYVHLLSSISSRQLEQNQFIQFSHANQPLLVFISNFELHSRQLITLLSISTSPEWVLYFCYEYPGNYNISGNDQKNWLIR